MKIFRIRNTVKTNFTTKKTTTTKTRFLIIATVVFAAISSAVAFSSNSTANSISDFLFGSASLGEQMINASPQNNSQKDDKSSRLRQLAPNSLISDLAVARQGHTATRLADGRVLITGGDADGTAEIFDAATGTSTATGSLGAARSGHTATRLADGRVLILGGTSNGTATSSTEVFDAATGTFSAGATMNAARSASTATVLADGKILIAGGDADGSAEIYDAAADSFTAISKMTTSRVGHSAALMKDGRVLIVGGSDADGNELKSAEIFNPKTGEFSATGNTMKYSRTRAVLNVLPDGKVQIIGGDETGSMEMFNAGGEYFTAYARLLDNAAGMAKTLRANTRAGLFHKQTLDAGNRAVGAVGEMFDRDNYSMTAIPQRILIAGGVNGNGTPLNSVVLLEASSATVTTDKTDYQPGETVIITGSGWLAGETVELTLSRDNDTPDTILTAVVDADGNFTNSDYLVQESDLNVVFLLTAVGQTSGYVAQTTFTDARQFKAEISPTSVGASQSVTYLVTITNTNTSPTTTQIGSVSILLPTGYSAAPTIGTITVTPSSKNWDPITTGTFVSGYDSTSRLIGLRARTAPDQLANLESFTVSITTTSPAAAGSYQWTSSAFANLNLTGNIFTIQSPPGQPTVTVTACTAPSISVNPSSATKTVGDSAMFSVTASGTATLSYQWRKGGVDISGATSSSYSIPSVLVSDAGSYDVVVSNACGSATSTPAILTVNKATPTITWANPANITYGTALSATQLNATASVGGTFVYTPASGTVLNAGNAQILSVAFTPTDTANYNNANQMVQINVLKATLTITANNKTITYGDADPTFDFAYSGFVNGDGAGVIDTPPTCTVAGAHTNAGSYTISCAGGADNNYNFSYVNGTLTVNKAMLTVTANNQTITYGDADPSFTFGYAGFKYTDNASVIDTPPNCSVSGAHTNAGSYTISCAGGADNNYDFSYVNGTLTVNQATLTVTANNQAITYGDADPTFTFGYSGFKFTDNASVIDTAPTCGVSGAHSNAGTYPIVCSGGVDNNYIFSYVNGTLTVNQKAASVTPNAASKTYGDADPTLTGTLSGFLTADGVSATYSRTAGETVGNYTISATLSPVGVLGNYNITYNTANFAINQRNASVTPDAQMKTYGSADPTLTGTLSGFLTADGVSATYSRTAGEAVGIYTISAVLSPAGVLGNYNITYNTANFTINPATLTVSADNKSKTYGDANPALTYSLSGFVNSENATMAGVTGSPVLSTTATANSAVGGYPITVDSVGTLAATNYSFVASTTNGTLTINARAITVTADGGQGKIYGDADPPLAYTITSGSLVSGDGFTGSLSRVAGEAVGIYAIQQGTLALNSNYALTFVGADFTITARNVTITADAKMKTYGDADPPLTYFITSGALQFSDAFTGALTRAAGEAVGSYAIQQGTLALSANYALTFVGANFTITARPITVTADAKMKTYGDADPALTYQITSGALQFSDAFTGALTRAPGENVSSYAIQQGTLALSSNYALTFVGADLTINARAVTVTADAKMKNYGDADPPLTYQITSGALQFSDAFTGGLTRVAGENVGTYAITQGTLALNSNYNLSYVGADLTITARAVTVTADAKMKIYGDSDPALTYQITSGSLAFSDAFSGGLVRTAGENVGNYAITQGTLVLSSNYVLTYIGADLTITARSITVTADAKMKTYGDADPALTYQITSGALQFSDAFTGALTRVAGESVGIYAITQGTLALSSNYALTFVGANLTINARAVTVTADGGQSKIYGDADPPLAYTITSGSLVSGDSFSGALTRAAGEAVGSYAIQQGTLALNSNYTLTFVSADFTITARNVTITADAKMKTYGDGDPALTYQITSGTLAFSDAFTGSLTRTAGEVVGAYPILQGTVALNSNYNLSYISANLTINQRAVTVTADAKMKTYGNADPALTYSITSGSLAFTDSFTGSLSRTAGESVGNYAITQGTLALSSNYALTFIGADLTINARAITVTADAKMKIYGDADPALTYQITSGALQFSDAFSGALTRAVGENVGSYAIQQGTLALSSNYNLTFVGANLTITQRALTITAVTNTKTYDGNTTAAATPTISGLQGTDTVTGLSETYDNRNAGTGKTLSVVAGYTVNDGNGGNNYAVSTVANTTGVINKAPLTITAVSNTKIYDGTTSAAATPTVSGLISPDTVTGLSETYDTKHVGTNKTLSVATYTVNDGNGGNNYNVSTVANTTGVITQRSLTITALTNTKVYDGTTTAAAVPTVSGTQIGDTVTGLSETYNNPNVGTGKTLSVATYTINDGNSGGNYSISLVPNTTGVITAAGTVSAVTVTPNSQQYSDKVTFEATLSPASILGVPPATNVSFYIGTQNMGTATLVVGTGANAGKLVGTLSNVALLETVAGQMSPGSKTVTAMFSGVNANFAVNNATTPLTITREDARIFYTGALFVNTTCATCSTATAQLSATVKDITAITGDPDMCGGDISKATLTFVNRDSNTDIATVPISLVSTSDTKVGTAVYNWNVNIGSADSLDYTVGFRVNGYYTRDASTDNEVVTISKPLGTFFITGGGHLVMTNPTSSAGQYAGAAGLKTNFGFNVKYNSSGRNLQGRVNVIVRGSGGRVYQIKGNQMDTLTVNNSNPAARTALYTGKCNLTDITDPLLPISLGGGHSFQMKLTDKGEPGNTDTVGITVYANNTGALLYSSRWNGTTTIEQLLGGGNTVVR